MTHANTDMPITTRTTRVGLIVTAALALIIGVMWGPATLASAAETNVTDAAGIQTAFENATGDDNLITLGGSITADETFPLVVPDGATVTLDLNGNHLTTTAATNFAGITVEAGSTLIIQDSGTGGTLAATGGTDGAGIGGGYRGTAGTTTTTGGTVIATGGDYAAGIGGGYSGDAGITTINGGIVIAAGGFDAAGIGGGDIGTGGITTITGGTVTATGGFDGAGIGGGAYGAGGITTITGGTITATGGYLAAGIGGGDFGDGAAVSIGADADVTASSPAGIAVGSGRDGTSFGSLSNAGTLTIPAGNGITVPDTTTITNSGTITVDGTIANAGVIEGPGTLTGTGSIANSGAITQSVTVIDTLRVTGNNYLLTFDANDADATGTPENMRVYASTLESAEASLPTAQPTLDEHTFTGWYSAPTAGEEWNETTTITDDATLYAQWDINSYTVTFDAQGGSAVAAANVDYGNPVTAPEEPNRDGYTFTGWYPAANDGTAWDFSTNVTEDITLYAQWDKDEVISPPADGGTDSDSQSTGSTDALPRTGADVTGWPFAGATLLILAGGALLALRRRRHA